jgi:isoaspartyl peptidase/L-asparaginase-like protein (Ntn-hydrolase superfamily)
MNRRQFMQHALLSGAAGAALTGGHAAQPSAAFSPGMIATWEHGKTAVDHGARMLQQGASALDIVEAGVNQVENDPEVTSVGLGGWPDETGVVSLDACIMDGRGHRAGSVAYLQGIRNPISVARKVMELTRHVMLAGDGALQFARQVGFREENLLTDEARRRWLEWKRNASPADNWLDGSHDTVTMLCLDRNGDLAGACSTSGLAWKLHGRVGDSPILGAGLYVDNAVGAAGATGVGELVMRTLTSFTIVEFMRQGMKPAEACRAAFERMCALIPEARTTQEAFIAINKSGEVGCATNSEDFVFHFSDGGPSQRNHPIPIR